MKNLLLLVAFTIVAYSATAQKAELTLKEQDSLVSLCIQIDQLSVFDLKKVQETFIYKCKNNPSAMDREILLYVEDKLKKTK